MLQAQKNPFGRSLPVYSTIGSAPTPLPSGQQNWKVFMKWVEHFGDQEGEDRGFGEGKRVPYNAI